MSVTQETIHATLDANGRLPLAEQPRVRPASEPEMG